MNVTALIPAAGSGRRMGGTLEKQFLPLGGKPLLTHTLARFEETPGVHRVVVIVPPGREEFCRQEVIEPQGFRKVRRIVAGAETRQGSVGAGLRCVGEDVDIVVVHDGARPFVTPALIQASIDAAAREGGAIVAIPEADTLKRVSAEGLVVETVDRRHLWRAQTPQAFRREVLQRALDHAEQHHIVGTDEASLVECLSRPVRIVMGSSWNLKITSPDDLVLAELLLAQYRGNEAFPHHLIAPLPSRAALEGA
jgi:2-C-methyl-D-erythritol 4-phosphate cytidylyltransferase